MTSCARRAHQAIVVQSSPVELPTGFGVDSEHAWRCNRWGPSSLSFPRNIRIYDQDLCHRLTKNSICLSLSPRSKYTIFMLSHWKFGDFVEDFQFNPRINFWFLKFPVIIYCWIYKWTIRAGGKPHWRIVRYSEYSQAIPSSLFLSLFI